MDSDSTKPSACLLWGDGEEERFEVVEGGSRGQGEDLSITTLVPDPKTGYE